jgi:hypothetical protein
MTMNDGDPEVQRARWEVRRFKQHLLTYVAVVGVLFVVNLLSGGWPGHVWFFWIALIWGIFLALQAAHLFGDDIGREWEQRMVDKVVARRRREETSAGPRPVYTPPAPPRPPAAPPPVSPGTGSI